MENLKPDGSNASGADLYFHVSTRSSMVPNGRTGTFGIPWYRCTYTHTSLAKTHALIAHSLTHSPAHPPTQPPIHSLAGAPSLPRPSTHTALLHITHSAQVHSHSGYMFVARRRRGGAGLGGRSALLQHVLPRRIDGADSTGVPFANKRWLSGQLREESDNVALPFFKNPADDTESAEIAELAQQHFSSALRHCHKPAFLQVCRDSLAVMLHHKVWLSQLCLCLNTQPFMNATTTTCLSVCSLGLRKTPSARLGDTRVVFLTTCGRASSSNARYAAGCAGVCVCLCLCLWSCTKVRFQCNLERPTNALLPARILCLGGVRAFQARSEAERTRTKLDTQLTAIMEHVQQVHDSVEVRTTQAAHGAKLVHLTAVQEQIAAAQLGAAQVAIMTAGFNGVRLWACVCSNRDDLWCL